MKYFRKLGLMTLLALAMLPAHAAMVTTAESAALAPAVQLSDSGMQRAQVRRQLIENGIEPAIAAERVAQMTDRQIAGLQVKLDELPAGAALNTVDLLLIIIIIILVL